MPLFTAELITGLLLHLTDIGSPKVVTDKLQRVLVLNAAARVVTNSRNHNRAERMSYTDGTSRNASSSVLDRGYM